MTRIIGIGAILGLLLSGCTQKQDVTAPKDINKSFTVVKAGDVSSSTQLQSYNSSSNSDRSKELSLDNYLISIKKDSLEKEFLLRAQLIQQSPVPSFNGLRSRIVSFRQQNNKVYMLEASDGHVVTQSLPTRLLIAEFNIINETEDTISIDFNGGMSHLFMTGAWYGHDFSGKKYQNQFTAVKVLNSYLDDAHVSEKSNVLVLRQVAQIYSAEGNVSDGSVQALYYLSAYQPSDNFQPYENDSYDWEGFFEVAPYINSEGRTTTYASKFNVNNPITFAVSSNTPKKYREAIKEGVLYWNKAFGAKIVKVVIAPEGISAPNPDYNIIQWVDWEGAGFAYADAQADPRTGEILNAQVYLTSVFAKGAETKIRRMDKTKDLLSMKLKGNGHEEHNSHVSLNGFHLNHNCEYNIREAWMKSAVELKKNDASEELILKAVRDQLRQVTAHEVGHTLGLRHNFAGSLAANYSLKDRGKLIQEYLLAKAAPLDLVVTSSMMDYLPAFDDFIAGDQALSLDTAAEYDEVAIQRLYYNRKLDNKPLFCTDSHVGPYADCERHDSSNNLVEYARYETLDQLTKIPYYIFNSMLRGAFPAKGVKAIPVNKAPLDTNVYINAVIAPRINFMISLFNSASLMSVDRQYDIVDYLNIDSVREHKNDWLLKQVTQIGGFAETLFVAPDEMEDVWLALFLKQLNNNASGITEQGVAYQLSQVQVEQMTERAVLFFAKYKVDLTKITIAILSQLQDLPDHALSTELLKYLDATLKYYVYATEDENSVSTMQLVNLDSNKYDLSLISNLNPEDSTVKYPKFKYDFETRALAAQLISAGKAPKSFEWGLRERMVNAQIMKALIKEVMGEISKKLDKLKPATESDLFEEDEVEESRHEMATKQAPEINPDEIDKILSPKLIRWIAENQMIMNFME